MSGKLSWSHYCELLSISDKDKRCFYEKECINAKWSVRELKRQIDSSLFERILLSKGNVNKEKVLELAAKGVEYANPSDLIELTAPYPAYEEHILLQIFDLTNLPKHILLLYHLYLYTK